MYHPASELFCGHESIVQNDGNVAVVRDARPSPSSNSKGNEDGKKGHDGEGNERFSKELHRLALLPFEIHEYGLEEKDVAHEGGRHHEQAQHRHRGEDGVGLFSYERRAVGNEEDDEDDIAPCRKRIDVRVLGHVCIIPNSTG